MAYVSDSKSTSISDGTLTWETLFGGSDESFHKVEGSLGCECAACCGATYQLGNSVGTTTSSQTSGAMPIFTLDEVAEQLTDGYWAATSNGTSRSFDISAGGALNVDLSGLREGGQALARQALDAWSAVSGLEFVELTSVGTTGEARAETFDAAAGTSTNYTMSLGDSFLGTLSGDGDRDAVAIELVAGQSYTFALRGDHTNGAGTADPYLRLLNASGTVVALNDDAEHRDSRLTFTATETGTHYAQAGSHRDSYAGDYRLEVTEASGNVHISFGDQASGAYASSQVVGDTIISSHVNVNSNWAGGEYRTDGFHFQTYLHEIGHALGLGHAGNYNGGAVFGEDNHYLNDSWAVSVMSYFHQQENSYTSSSFAFAITPMAADILAIQSLYGAPEESAEDTTYGRNANSGTHLDEVFDFAAPTAWTVFDAGGTDHFDFSEFMQDQWVDLREGSSSDVGGVIGNVSVAFGTLIEKATSGGGNDRMIGNAGDNELRAGEGADTIQGGAGQDRMFGGGGTDAIFGGDGHDSLSGDDDMDLLEGGAGYDDLSGGAGNDLLFGDGISLAELEKAFPTWTPSENAADQIAAGEEYLVWDSILHDVFEIA